MRLGEDARLPNDWKTGTVQHTILSVYGEMLLQIAMEYPGLPDARELTLSQIRFWFEGVRATLKKRTASR